MTETKKERLFRFNLLPKKNKVDIENEAERSDSVFYSILLVFFASLVFFAVNLFNLFILEPAVLTAQQGVEQREVGVESYEAIRADHGELFIKTKTLAPVLEKKVNTSEIFRVANQIASISASLSISSYSREPSGLFVFDVESPSFQQVSLLITQAKEISGTSQLFVRSSIYQSSKGKVKTTLELNIDAV